MNQNETMETSAVMGTSSPDADFAADEAVMDARLLAEAEEVKAVYPDFDPDAALEHPVLGALMRGETQPSLRQLYEAVHLEEIVEGRIASAVEAQVSSAVESAVSEAVAQAVRETEERLLEHIRARGQRPAENGLSAAAGIRMHPAVDRLTRRERAMLAKRAENGETVKL